MKAVLWMVIVYGSLNTTSLADRYTSTDFRTVRDGITGANVRVCGKCREGDPCGTFFNIADSCGYSCVTSITVAGGFVYVEMCQGGDFRLTDFVLQSGKCPFAPIPDGVRAHRYAVYLVDSLAFRGHADVIGGQIFTPWGGEFTCPTTATPAAPTRTATVPAQTPTSRPSTVPPTTTPQRSVTPIPCLFGPSLCPPTPASSPASTATPSPTPSYTPTSRPTETAAPTVAQTLPPAASRTPTSPAPPGLTPTRTLPVPSVSAVPTSTLATPAPRPSPIPPNRTRVPAVTVLPRTTLIPTPQGTLSSLTPTVIGTPTAKPGKPSTSQSGSGCALAIAATGLAAAIAAKWNSLVARVKGWFK